jgi:ABC-type lipoprotein export system ATPase subunit
VNRPPVILADEPTAPLDSERALAVIRIFNQMTLQYEIAIKFTQKLDFPIADACEAELSTLGRQSI